MIKRFLLILSLILGSTTPHLLSFSKSPVISDTNADLYFTSYSSQVSDAVHAILKHPEARKLLQEVTRDGKIRIEVPKSFNASFDSILFALEPLEEIVFFYSLIELFADQVFPFFACAEVIDHHNVS